MNSSINKFIVITTINYKSKAIEAFEKKKDWNLIVIGDKKSKPINSSGNLFFLSIDDQQKLGFDFVKVCPYNHYGRKNIGYLYAIQQGADVIYDTDDDNFPLGNWGLPDFWCENTFMPDIKFFNIYNYFYEGIVWPRGYPLDEIKSNKSYYQKKTGPVEIGVWQGMVDLDADVDAIYRLIFNKQIKFFDKDPVYLKNGNYCPFNSQNTFWQKKTFPFLYLPSTTSFRFTDILRGYIAQRMMWIQDLYLGFHNSTVVQKRNIHNLMQDFVDELECYLNIKPIVNILGSMAFGEDAIETMKKIYITLNKKGFVRDNELMILDSWIKDYLRVKT